jgi:hypothetical protein
MDGELEEEGLHQGLVAAAGGLGVRGLAGDVVVPLLGAALAPLAWFAVQECESSQV